jgi:putative hemin transport protein
VKLPLARRQHDGLGEAWRWLRRREPRLGQRAGAARLGVTEAELVAAQVGEGALRLDARWTELLAGLAAVGEVRASTRNEHAVLEEVGVFAGLTRVGPRADQVGGLRIDLRLDLARWHAGFALDEPAEDGLRRSLQIFDEHGAATHEVSLAEGGSRAEWTALVRRHAGPLQATSEPVTRVERSTELPDGAIDGEGLRAAWAARQGTHELGGLLRRFGVSRAQALRLCPAWAAPVATLAHRRLFEVARDEGLPLVVLVGSRGTTQIHTGAPRRLLLKDGWWNVLDPLWRLRVCEPGIASAWVVRKPTRDGVVRSLELYDERGETIALCFCKPRTAAGEDPAWVGIMELLVQAGPSSAVM